MASINKVIILGHLGHDPDVRTMTNGGIVAQLSVATTRRYRAQTGETKTETEWHRLVVFGRLAEIARDYLKRASLAYFEGRLRTRKYTDQQGVEKYTTEIVCENMQLLDRRSDGAQGHEQSQPAPQARPAASARSAAPVPAAKPSRGPDDSISDDDIPF